jgi:hypothetical protein
MRGSGRSECSRTVLFVPVGSAFLIAFPNEHAMRACNREHAGQELT